MITVLVLLGALAASGIAATVVAVARDGHRRVTTRGSGRAEGWAHAAWAGTPPLPDYEASEANASS
ncbi:hypothetical protein [Herbiconiux sp. A18JL235]|uniref:Uncharacterized protein n=1 Tax=Herbiconiux sp. A18JL235 TaxID=3152363 RepID=A0AB39BKJ8_9MICO